MNNLSKLINEKLDFFIIGEKATSYRMPLVVTRIDEYEAKDCICIETKNIRCGKYLVFDKESFTEAVKQYIKTQGNNNNDNRKQET